MTYKFIKIKNTDTLNAGDSVYSGNCTEYKLVYGPDSVGKYAVQNTCGVYFLLSNLYKRIDSLFEVEGIHVYPGDKLYHQYGHPGEQFEVTGLHDEFRAKIRSSIHPDFERVSIHYLKWNDPNPKKIEKSGWVNIYKSCGNIWFGTLASTKEECIKNASSSCDLLDTIQINWTE